MFYQTYTAHKALNLKVKG